MVDQEENRLPSEGEEPTEATSDIVSETPAYESASVSPKQIMITDEELREMRKEVTEYKDKYLRLLADADNSRKRLQKEKQELTRYAIENLIVEFLPPLDNLENALGFAQEMSDEVRNWAFGFQMILAQFKDILVQNGIVAIESLGQPFNPHLHEAIEMIETTAHPSGTIVEECIRGYKMGEKTIRPARVKIAKGKEPSATAEDINQNENI